jgi:hypothetical protein
LEAVLVGRLHGCHFLEANMKTILSAALVLALGGVAGAEGEKVDKDGDKLAGTMSWPDQKETMLKDLKLTDGALKFSAERKIMDNTLTVDYDLTITGDKLKGKGAVEVGGEKREFDIEGKREKNK